MKLCHFQLSKKNLTCNHLLQISPGFFFLFLMFYNFLKPLVSRLMIRDINLLDVPIQILKQSINSLRSYRVMIVGSKIDSSSWRRIELLHEGDDVLFGGFHQTKIIKLIDSLCRNIVTNYISTMPSEHEQKYSEILTCVTLLFLTAYLVLSALTKSKHFPVHRTSIAIVIGIVAGVIISLAVPKVYKAIMKLDQFIVFSILFPPMIFAKGYTFHKNVVKKNVKYIIIFGLIGTFISFLVSWGFIYLANSMDLVIDSQDVTNFRSLSDWEILLLAACLCSIDTISSQETVSEHRLPRLYSIIFGQDVLKDAVTIVLFRSILNLQERESPQKLVIYWYTFFSILLNFTVLILGSVFFGLVSAFLATYLIKKLRFLSNDNGVTQTGFLFLIGFMLYIVTQWLNFSGSISLLLYGILLNHYNVYNMSPQAQITSTNTFNLIGTICQGLLFLIMGIMVCQGQWLSPSESSDKMTHSYVFFFIVMIILFVARFINVYVLSWISQVFSKKFNKRFDISKGQKLILFIGGMVRGATPFVLFTSVSFGGEESKYNRNQGVVLKTTIIFVITFTSVVLNSVIPIIYKKKKSQLLKENKTRQISDVKKQKKIGKFGKFQEKYIKTFLILDYNQRKQQILQQKRRKSDAIKEQVRQQEAQQQKQAQNSLGAVQTNQELLIQ